MLYDNYRNKILQRAQRIKRIIRLWPVIAAVLLAAISSLATLAVFSGTVTNITFSSSVFYGDVAEHSATAFLSEARFEYSASDDVPWSTEAPQAPGDYRVRIATSGFFGEKYKYLENFHIIPRRINVTVVGGTVRYGESPRVSADLVAGHTVFCDGFVYEEPLLTETRVHASSDAIKIYDGLGNDVTAFYEIATPYADVTVTPKELIIYVADATHEYDGKEFSYKIYELAEGALLNGEKLQAKFEQTITDVGTVKNTPVVNVVNSNGDDITHFYALNERNIGNLIVTKRPLYIITGSASYEFDGTSKQCLEYSLGMGTSLLPGHEIVADGVKSATFAGVVNNTMSFSVKDENGRDVTDNYAITIIEGTLEIAKKNITVITGSGSWEYDGQSHYNRDYTVEGLEFGYTSENIRNLTYITDVGTEKNTFEVSVFNGTSDISENFEITYVYGTLEVTKRHITIETPSYSWVYDAEVHNIPSDVMLSCKVIAGELPYAHVISYEELLSLGRPDIINVGTVTNIETIRIKSGTIDKTSNFEITYVYGTLEVTPRPITVRPKIVSKVYDGMPLYATEIEFLDIGNNLAKDTHIIEYSIEGSRKNVYDTDVSVISEIKITENGKDITYNYDITRLDGEIVIEKRHISITSGSDIKKYDGIPLTCNEFFVVEGTLVDGHRISATALGSQTKVGKSDNFYNEKNVHILCGTEELSANYDIACDFGTLEVYEIQASFTVISLNAAKVYDGKPLICDDYTMEYRFGDICPDHSIEVIITGSITDVGTAPNTIASVRMLDAEGNDVSYMYEIKTEEGILRVEEKIDTDYVFMKLRAEKTGPIYLKMKSYGDYNGKAWNDADAYNKLINEKYNASYFTSIALSGAGAEAYSVYITEAMVYMLPYYSDMSGSYGVPSDDVNIAGTFDYTEYTVPYFALENYSEKLAYLTGNLGYYSSAEQKYREFVYDNYTAIDAQTYDYMKSIIEKKGFDANDSDIILKVAAYIQNAAEYNLEYDKGLDFSENIAIDFLEKYKEGICIHYATAATLLYRALGIPARYVDGFMVNAVAGETVEVRNPGHAWVEIYIDSVGWVQVEVTGGYGENGGGSADGEHGDNGDYNNGKLTLEITPTYQYKKYDGTPLYATNEIVETSMLSMLLKMGYSYTVTVSGEITDIGAGHSFAKDFVLYDMNKKDVTDEFNIKYLEGKLEILSGDTKIIKIYLYETKKVYDGMPIVIGDYDYEIIDGGDGVTLDIDFIMDVRNVGEITLSMLNSNIESYIKYTVYDGQNNVTAEYRVEFGVFDGMDEGSYVPIDITKRKITITAASATKIYDGNVLECDKADVTFGVLASGDVLTVFTEGSITDVGEALNIVKKCDIVNSSGANVTNNYEITLFDGTLTVTEKK